MPAAGLCAVPVGLIIGLLAIVFVAGVGRIAGAVVAGIMFSAAGLFVTFLNSHLNIGGYQAIVLTAVQNPDRITGTSTGTGPAVALAKLQDRVTGAYRNRLPGPVGDESKDSLQGNGKHAPVQDQSH